MASKKENELKYLQMPIPKAQSSYKIIKLSWSGLNMRSELDTGAITMERNISTSQAPYLTPSPYRVDAIGGDFREGAPIKQSAAYPYEHPIGLFGFDDFLLMIYRDGLGAASGDESIIIDYIYDGNRRCLGFLKVNCDKNGADDYVRNIVQFNKYDALTSPIDGKFTKKLLIFPDKKSIDFTPQKYNDTNYYDHFTPADMDPYIVTEYTPQGDSEDPPPDGVEKDDFHYYINSVTSMIYTWGEHEETSKIEDEEGNTTYETKTVVGWFKTTIPAFPDIEYGAVFSSRLFGVSKTRVFASGFNDYANWELETISDGIEDDNVGYDALAWCSPSQSNTKAGGEFKGISVYNNHVVCFKDDFMQEVYNTKYPFRLVDTYAVGTIDNRSIQEVNGRLIFVARDGVKSYSGSAPKDIGYALGIDEFKKAVSGTDGRNYYLYCQDQKNVPHLFTYDTYTELWSEQSLFQRLKNATSDGELYSEIESYDYYELEPLSFAHNKNGMYMLCTDGYIYKLNPQQNDFSYEYYRHNWCFETDLTTRQSTSTVDIKHVKKIQMLADITYSGAAWLKVYALYDGEEFNADTSQLVYDSQKKNSRGKVAVRIKLRMSAHYAVKLHFEGYGYVKLYEMELFMEKGGDLYV